MKITKILSIVLKYILKFLNYLLNLVNFLTFLFIALEIYNLLRYNEIWC